MGSPPRSPHLAWVVWLAGCCTLALQPRAQLSPHRSTFSSRPLQTHVQNMCVIAILSSWDVAATQLSQLSLIVLRSQVYV
jgi:hypothetical protein